jgi:HPt (histidine-containing phosphotransfer) domain-containing protein
MQVPVELKRKYLDRRIQDIDHLISSLEVNDFGPAVKLGHQVKGNAVTFDFPQIAPFGIKIETAAKKQDKEGVKHLIQLMASEIHLARLSFH